jgi:hypothetical protein
MDASAHVDGPIALYPVGYAMPALCTMISLLSVALPGACCAQGIRFIAAAAETHIQAPNVQHIVAAFNLSALEAQSIFVYTASQDLAICSTHGAPFNSYNVTLRGAEANSVSTWSGYSFLLYNALLKLPSVACTVFRGLNVPLSEVSHLYCKGGLVWLRSPTSTTTDKNKTMREFGQGVASRAGTFMELRVKNAKEIETFSAVPGERERLIPQNTCFRVLQAFSSADLDAIRTFGSLPPNVDLVVLEEVKASVHG